MTRNEAAAGTSEASDPLDGPRSPHYLAGNKGVATGGNVFARESYIIEAEDDGVGWTLSLPRNVTDRGVWRVERVR